MTEFKYTGDRDGVTDFGSVESVSKSAAVKQLKEAGYENVRITGKVGDYLTSGLGRMFRRS